MRKQALVFGEVADAYDRYRPGYPRAVFDDILAYAGLAKRPGRVLDVGAGTGKSTLGFAERGQEVVCLEPSPDMAASAARNCAPYPSARVVVSSFEEFDGERGAFDLVASGQAWHWVAVNPGCWAKAHQLLRPGGVIALFWNRPAMPDAALRSTLDGIYERLAPTLAARSPGSLGKMRDHPDTEMAASGLFRPEPGRHHRQSIPYTTEQYVGLMTTQSDHRMLPSQQLGDLLEAIRRAMDVAGGQVTMEYETDLYLGRPVHNL